MKKSAFDMRRSLRDAGEQAARALKAGFGEIKDGTHSMFRALVTPEIRLAGLERNLLEEGLRARKNFERLALHSAMRAPRFTRAYGVRGQWYYTPRTTPLATALQSAWDNGQSVGAALRQKVATLWHVPSAGNLRWSRLPVRARQLILLGLTGSMATFAVASTLAVKGYLDNPASLWQERLQQRLVSPLYDSAGTLIGAVDTQGKLPASAAYDFAYIPLAADVPPTFKSALLYLENRHLYEGGIHNICGIDLTSFARVVRLAGGGSGLAQQLAFNLKQPDWSRGTGLSKVIRSLQQFGAACSLYRTLGSEDALVKAYSSYAPMYKGRGVLHGIEAAARVIWDVAPQALTHAQQLVLASAVMMPLAIVPEASRSVSCLSVFPARDNPQYSADLAKNHLARKIECQVLNRAIYAANGVLEGVDRDTAIAELRRYQAEGINPANPFEPVDTDKLVNLSSRTVSTMPESLLRQVKKEAVRADHQPGQPLTIGLDVVQQNEFAALMNSALEQTQRSGAGRSLLCIPLVKTSNMTVLRPCGVTDPEVVANVLAIKSDLRTGAIKIMYSSNPLLLDQQQSMGSLAKLIVLTAAVAEGYGADSMWCPKKAFDGKRPLKRVTAPAFGFDDCAGGKHALTLAQATARSDNLAYYQLAQALGEHKLLNAARVLGLNAQGTENPAYAMAFGTFGASPKELLAAGQALFSVAYGVQLTGQAPTILTEQASTHRNIGARVGKFLPTSEQRGTLRMLLEAPVQTPHGTLSSQKRNVTAGKSGTVQSAMHDPQGNNYGHGKFALSYSANTGDLNLWMVSSPLPSIPLALHQVQGSLFDSEQALLTKSLKD